MTNFNNGHDSFQNLLVDSHQNAHTEQIIQRVDFSHSGSNAEQTIQRYFTSNTIPPSSKPLVTKPNGLTCLKNPCNGYISKWPDGFSGYIVCGSTNHRFDSCPKREMFDDKKIF